MRLVNVVWVLLAGASWAGQKTVILTAGDCADAGLIGGAKDFRESTRKLLGSDIMEPDTVLDIVRPRPTRSVQDLERQIDSAKTLFYGGQNERALELLDRALAELERADPDAKPWKATENAYILQALVFKNLDRTRDMNEAFRRIVRINPTLRLDSEAHAPSTIAALEAVKKDVARIKKISLSIRVESGAPGSVAIDGQVMGVTPLKLDLIPGAYRVSVFNGSALSFPHRVELPRDSKLAIDLAFEGAVSRQLPLCMSNVDDGAAIKLAQLVSAERLIVLRNMAKGGVPPYVSGAIYDVGSARQERTGAVSADMMSNLATFLVTGREVAGIRRPDAVPVATAPVTKPPSDSPSAPVVKTEPPKDVSKPVDAPTVTEPTPLVPSSPPAEITEVSSRGFISPGRVVGFGLVAAGIVAVALTASYTVNVSEKASAEGVPGLGRLDSIEKEQEKYPSPVPGPQGAAGREVLEKLAIRASLQQTVGPLFGLGGAAILSGVLAIIFFPPEAPKVSVGPTSGGAAVSLSGSF